MRSIWSGPVLIPRNNRSVSQSGGDALALWHGGPASSRSGVWLRDVTAEKSTVTSEIPQLHFVPGRPVRGAGRVYLGDTAFGPGKMVQEIR